jgi:hypothetical protein
MSSSSGGLYSFKASSGVYDIFIYSRLPLTKVSLIEDYSILYFVNEGVDLLYGDAVYVSGDGSVSLASSATLAPQSRNIAICIDTTVMSGSTGRFRTVGLINRDGTPGALGYLSESGEITETVPSYDGGDLYSTILGRQFSNSSFYIRKYDPTLEGLLGGEYTPSLDFSESRNSMYSPDIF